MKIENKYIKVSKTARFTHLKSETQPNSKVVLVLHGYGQLSTFFARKFADIESDFDFAIAEGLNRFYLSGSSGRVGASWMTKEERLIDIADNQMYIQQLVDMLKVEYSEILLLGFSQGGATASRYYCENRSQLVGLVLWANVLPPDIAPLNGIFTKSRDYFVLGKEDPYFELDKQKEVLTLHQELGFETIVFDGKHDIDANVLRSILLNF